MKIIVIGANHAGTAVVRTLKRLDPKAEVVAYDRNDNISYLGCGTALWIEGEFQDPQGLFYATPKLLQEEGVAIHMNVLLQKIDCPNKTVYLKDLKTNKEFQDKYDKLILATGSWPIIPKIPGIHSKNVYIAKWFQHAQILKAACNNQKLENVVIVGAGYIGLELAVAFAKKGRKVSIIDVADRIMPNYYDQEFTGVVENMLQKHGIKLFLNHKVEQFVTKNDVVYEIKTNKNTIKCDAICWCAGFQPATEFIGSSLKLDSNQAIHVNEYMQTSDPNVYAVGDAINVNNNATGQHQYIALATNAVRTGIIAAINTLKHDSLPCPGFQGSNAIHLFELHLAGTGLNETVAKMRKIDYDAVLFSDADRPEFMRTQKEVSIKILWRKDNHQIIGAQIMSENNHTEMIHMFSLAILKKLTIDELALVDLFFLPHYNKPFNYVTLAGLEVLGLNFFKKEK